GKVKNNNQGRNSSRQGPTRNADGLHSHYDNKPVTVRLHFHYDRSGNLIAESDAKGNIVREYIYLGNYRIAMTTTSLDKPSMSPDVISTGAAAGRGVEKSRSLTLYFIHNDHLGTPHKVTDGEQRIVWSMEQAPFGEVNLTTVAIHMPMRFPGQYADVESGFSYNYFRDYDPSLGRYIQSDPIGLTSGLNSYVYVGARPLLSMDPLGLWSVTVELYGGVGGAVTLSYDESVGTYELTGRVGVGIAVGASFEPEGKPSPHAKSCGYGLIGRTNLTASAGLGLGLITFGGQASYVTGNGFEQPTGGEYLYLGSPLGVSNDTSLGLRGGISWSAEIGSYGQIGDLWK
ncbi:MAG: RHS domain-containing protein, partial [Pseudomonadales bacterium]|nr:RHS domain-containing protein [Pseudomonadales bacterium]